MVGFWKLKYSIAWGVFWFLRYSRTLPAAHQAQHRQRALGQNGVRSTCTLDLRTLSVPGIAMARVYAIPNDSSKHAATSTQSWQPLKAGARGCAQDLSHLRFEAYDADFNRTLAAAETLRSLDEVRKCVKCGRRCTI